MLSLQGYLGLAASYPFARVILQGLLSMAVAQGLMPLRDARCIYDQLLKDDRNHSASTQAILVVDQHRALTDVRASQMEVLADGFTFKVVLDDFTNFEELDQFNN